MVRTPPPTVSGMTQASAVRRTTSSMMPRFAWVAVMSRKHSSSAPAASYAIAASTGSPASRRSTKLTPFTTRPSLTSRQGMTRTLNMAISSGRGARVADQGQRGSRIEPSVIERPAGNGAGQFSGARRKQRFHILDRGEAARGNHRNGDLFGELDGGVEIQPLEQAVSRDVGEDNSGHAGVLEAPGDVQRAHLRGLRPTLDRDLAVARIETNGYASRKRFRRLLYQIRIPHRRGADDDTRDAFLQPRLHGAKVANAAAELHRHADGREHALHRLRIDRLAGERAVEIDHVQVFKALRRKGARLGCGIEIEHGGARHVALLEAHALAVLQIDGGKQDHGFHFMKFEIRASPKRWLFSG